MSTPLEIKEYWQTIIENDPDGHALVDRCDLWPWGKVEGGAAGDTFTHTPGASDIPCVLETTSNNFQYVVGGETHIASHRLFLIRSTEALAIKPTHLIKVQPREDVGELVFQHPVVLPESLNPLLTVVAKLVVQGHG